MGLAGVKPGNLGLALGLAPRLTALAPGTRFNHGDNVTVTL